MPCLKFKKRGAVILMLLAAMTLAAAAPMTVAADPYQGVSLDDPVGGGGTGLGDPDQPDGSGKASRVAQGRVVIGSQHLAGRVAGDDSWAEGIRMWRWYVIRLWQRGSWLLP